MGNLRVVMDSPMLMGILFLAVGLSFIPLSQVPSIHRSSIVESSTQRVVEGPCPPEVSVYLDKGTYIINLAGPFIIGPSSSVEVRDDNKSLVYQSSIDAPPIYAQLGFSVADFSVANPATYTITIKNGAADLQLLRLAGQTVWSESVTYPGQQLIIISIVIAPIGAAILLARGLVRTEFQRRHSRAL